MTGSKKRGNQWEDTIEAENELLRVQGDARVKRAEDAFRVIGAHKDGTPKVVRKRRSEPDFYGLCEGGLHVAFDAKRSKAPRRFPLPDPRKPDRSWWHQVEKLSEISAFGGLAFLYVLIEDEDNPFRSRRYVFPVRNGLIADLDPRLDRSIRLADSAAYIVPSSLSWLDVVATNLQWWR